VSPDARPQTDNDTRGRDKISTGAICGLAAPCKYLERLTQSGVFAAMKSRGGLRADILEGGTIADNDEIVVI
jgi:hypothetical protein